MDHDAVDLADSVRESLGQFISTNEVALSVEAIKLSFPELGITIRVTLQIDEVAAIDFLTIEESDEIVKNKHAARHRAQSLVIRLALKKWGK